MLAGSPEGLLRSRKRKKKEEREPIVVLNLVLNCLHLINRGGRQRWNLVQRRLSWSSMHAHSRWALLPLLNPFFREHHSITNTLGSRAFSKWERLSRLSRFTASRIRLLYVQVPHSIRSEQTSLLACIFHLDSRQNDFGSVHSEQFPFARPSSLQRR